MKYESKYAMQADGNVSKWSNPQRTFSYSLVKTEDVSPISRTFTHGQHTHLVKPGVRSRNAIEPAGGAAAKKRVPGADQPRAAPPKRKPATFARQRS